jgi:hypothetical protein
MGLKVNVRGFGLEIVVRLVDVAIWNECEGCGQCRDGGTPMTLQDLVGVAGTTTTQYRELWMSQSHGNASFPSLVLKLKLNPVEQMFGMAGKMPYMEVTKDHYG